MTTPTTSAVQKPPVDPAIGAAIEVYGRLNAIRNVLAPDLNDQELQLFALVAQRSRLDPFAKQIYAIKRAGRVTFQTGIDGFRSSAEETDEYRGSDEPEFGPMLDKPFPHPEWARVIVHRQFKNGEWLHQPATVYFSEMYPGDHLGAQWRKMPRVMLAKCAEAAAFRKAFPKRFADVYAAEEMHQAEAAELARPVAPTARDRVAERRAQLEAQAAVAACPPSPRGKACALEPGHGGDEHKAGNVRWPRQPNEGRGEPAPAEGSAPGGAAPDATAAAAPGPLAGTAAATDEEPAVTAEFTVEEVDAVIAEAAPAGDLWQGRKER